MTTLTPQDLAKARKTKIAFQKVHSEADQTLRNIATEESWLWARHLTDLLRVAQSKLLEVVASDKFAKAAINMEIADVKKQMPMADFDAGIKLFSLKIDPPVAQLAKEIKILREQHRARMRVL